jgi:hypothetical protein
MGSLPYEVQLGLVQILQPLFITIGGLFVLLFIGNLGNLSITVPIITVLVTIFVYCPYRLWRLHRREQQRNINKIDPGDFDKRASQLEPNRKSLIDKKLNLATLHSVEDDFSDLASVDHNNTNKKFGGELDGISDLSSSSTRRSDSRSSSSTPSNSSLTSSSTASTLISKDVSVSSTSDTTTSSSMSHHKLRVGEGVISADSSHTVTDSLSDLNSSDVESSLHESDMSSASLESNDSVIVRDRAGNVLTDQAMLDEHKRQKTAEKRFAQLFREVGHDTAIASPAKSPKSSKKPVKPPKTAKKKGPTVTPTVPPPVKSVATAASKPSSDDLAADTLAHMMANVDTLDIDALLAAATITGDATAPDLFEQHTMSYLLTTQRQTSGESNVQRAHLDGILALSEKERRELEFELGRK